MDSFLQQVINAISLGAIYSLFALGYALVFSILGVLNLAHSAVFMAGAFFGLALVDKMGQPLWVAAPLAMIGAGLVSVALELVAFRPLRRRGAERMSQLISSIGAALLIVNLAQLAFKALWGGTEAYFPQGLVPDQPIVIEALSLRIVPIRMIILVIAIALVVALQYLVMRTRIGQQMRTVAFNQRTAALLGVNVGRVYVITFFLAGVLGGAAGMLYGLVFLNITPFIGDDVALVGLTAIVLGGLGSINGALIGGFLVAAIQTASIAVGGSNYKNAVVFGLLFLLLLVRPQGLLGQADSTRA
jgi:branched-chain amino acid transport system permease protein